MFFCCLLDAPSTTASDLRLLLNDLTGDKNDKKQHNKHNDTYPIDNNNQVYDDIEDDLALILNDKQPKPIPKPIESKTDDNDQQRQQTKSKLQDSMITTSTTAMGRNRLNHSDEFYQIRTQLQEQYNLKSNLNHFLEQHFNDDLDDYKSTKTLLQNNKQHHDMQHHEIDTSTLRINPQESHRRRSHSASSKIKQNSLKKGFLRSSSNTLNVRPIVHKHDFNDTTTITDNDLTSNVKLANKHRLLLGNEHDIVQVLNEQFPGIYVSNEMQAKLNDQFSKHIDNVFKSRMELLNMQQGNMNDVRYLLKIENNIIRIFQIYIFV